MIDEEINAAQSNYKETSYSEHRIIDSMKATKLYTPWRTKNRSSSTGNKELLVDKPSKKDYRIEERWIRLHEIMFSSRVMPLCDACNHHYESKFKKFSKHKSYFLGRDENLVTIKESINDCLLQRHQNLEFGADKDFIDSDDSFEAHADR